MEPPRGVGLGACSGAEGACRTKSVEWYKEIEKRGYETRRKEGEKKE
jgi:hypothetical protein